VIHLITGGAGFLGSHLVRGLIDDGHSVIIVDNLSTGHVRNLEHAVSRGATFIYADVAVPFAELTATLDKAIRGRRIDRIYHLASPASPKAYGAAPWETLEVNGIGTMSLIRLALEHGARFLFTSTSEVYGDPLVHPQPESYFGNVNPVGPRSCYDEGKRFGEAAVAAAVRARGLDARIVRLFNCYGPAMDEADGRLVPELFDAAIANRPLPIHGTGKQTRSMTYIDDAVYMIRSIMESDHSGLQPLNVGNDVEFAVEDVARAVARVVGIDYVAEYLPGREEDPQRRKPDLTLSAKHRRPQPTSLDDGLRETYRWLRELRAVFA
jgi:nucleoside-diphosphate-sugar epimerase